MPHPYSPSCSQEKIDPNITDTSAPVGHKYPSCLQALQVGFEELIKCRIFLIGCAAYSYNLFTENTIEDNIEGLMR